MDVGNHPRRPLLMLLMLAVTGATAYRTFSAERDCASGNLSVTLNATGDASSAALLRSTEHASYSMAMDCRMMLAAPEGHRVVLALREIGFRTEWDGSCKDYLQIADQPAMCSHLFRADEERHFYSVDNSMDMLYHVSPKELDASSSGHPGFFVVATAFTDGHRCPIDDDGGGQRFRCENGHCIWSGLRCDSHNNCGDLSDEVDCDHVGGSHSSVLIILGVIILLLLLIMCAATLLCSKNENVRRLSNRLRSRTISYVTRLSRGK